jgi:hypothetical protein
VTGRDEALTLRAVVTVMETESGARLGCGKCDHISEVMRRRSRIEYGFELINMLYHIEDKHPDWLAT